MGCFTIGSIKRRLQYIFNLPSTNGVVHDALKVAKVIPVFEKGDANIDEYPC
jgi:hypothetical protein